MAPVPVCEGKHEAKVTVKRSNIVEEVFVVSGLGLFVESTFIQPPWMSEVRWKWGTKWPNQMTSLSLLKVPLRSLTYEDYYSGPNYWGGHLGALDYDNVWKNCSNFRSNDPVTPTSCPTYYTYNKNQKPPQPVLLGYVRTPPPEVETLRFTGTIGRVYTASKGVLSWQAECGCDYATEIQCGSLATNDHCCISCSSVSQSLLSSAGRIEGLINEVNSL